MTNIQRIGESLKNLKQLSLLRECHMYVYVADILNNEQSQRWISAGWERKPQDVNTLKLDGKMFHKCSKVIT